jgi:hypothetical protein
MPWERKKEKFLGGLSINHMIRNFRGEIHVEQIKFIGFQSYVSCVSYSESNNIVCVGLGNGTIYLYKINVNDQKGRKNEFIEEVSLHFDLAMLHQGPQICNHRYRSSVLDWVYFLLRQGESPHHF